MRRSSSCDLDRSHCGDVRSGINVQQQDFRHLEAQANAMGFVPQDGADAEAVGEDADALDDAEEDEEALVAA